MKNIYIFIYFCISISVILGSAVIYWNVIMSRLNFIPAPLDIVPPSSISWVSLATNKKSTSYSFLSVSVWENMKGWTITSILSTKGGQISNVLINWSWNIQFDWVTPNFPWTVLKFSWIDPWWNIFTNLSLIVSWLTNP